MAAETAGAPGDPLLDPVVLALDTHEPGRAREWLAAYPGLRRAKVGLELFLAAGFDFVDELVAEGIWVFLDLKLHDIPHTVGRAAAELVRHRVGLTTVHALGGPRMVAAAAAAREKGAGSAPAGATRIVAVTALTSHDPGEWQSLGMAQEIAPSAMALARSATGAGADGVVCSPWEVADLRAALGPDALLVTPGIRLAGQDAGDQRRVATPSRALADGASYLVVGRALTAAADPAAALDALRDDLDRAPRPA